MNRISHFGRIAAGIVLAAGAAFTPGVARAQRLGNDTIALFPKNIGEFARGLVRSKLNGALLRARSIRAAAIC